MSDPTYSTIERCLERFNFERVHKMMIAVDWKWAINLHPDGARVPTIHELRDGAKRLLYAAVHGAGTISSGGFVASYHAKYGRACVTLRFVAAETWQNYE